MTGTPAIAAPAQVHIQPIAVRIPDACRMTGIGRSKLYELIESGDIAIVKVGRMTLVPVANLEKFIEQRASA